MSFPHEVAFDLLRQSHAAGRLGHAYLISGSEASETRRLAGQLAGLVTGSGSTLESPDIHVAEPESKSRRIRIEQTRRLERDLQMRSLLGTRKVAVLLDADRLTTEAANSFLKTLEEPPGDSVVVLTSTAPETLPDTILSRCIAVPLSRRPGQPALSPEQKTLLGSLHVYAQRKAASLADVFLLVQDFLNLLRSARESISDETATSLKSEETHYKQTTDSKDWLDDREDHYKAVAESRYIEQRLALVRTLLEWFADVLRHQSSFTALDFPDFAADTARVAGRLTPGEALRRFAHLEELRENLNRTGVQEQLAIEVAFLNAF